MAYVVVPQTFIVYDLLVAILCIFFVIGTILIYALKKHLFIKYLILSGCIFLLTGILCPILYYTKELNGLDPYGRFISWWEPAYSYLYDINPIFYLLFFVILIVAIIYLFSKNQKLLNFQRYFPLLILAIISIIINTYSLLKLDELITTTLNTIHNAHSVQLFGTIYNTPAINPIYAGIISIYIGSVILIIADIVKSRFNLSNIENN